MCLVFFYAVDLCRSFVNLAFSYQRKMILYVSIVLFGSTHVANHYGFTLIGNIWATKSPLTRMFGIEDSDR